MPFILLNTKIKVFLTLLMICFVFNSSMAEPFPDKGGLLNFDEPESINDHLFILTNPKSGSHLLLYSIVRLTKRPLRGRLPLYLYILDPPCSKVDNILNCELDFSKPTIYWGHEYTLLSRLDSSKNKLIFTHRNFKETISSDIILRHYKGEENFSLDEAFRNEILLERSIFQEYMKRLEIFEAWNESNRLLVKFEDLVQHPGNFIPQVLNFIEEPVFYDAFVQQYEQFKSELMEKYEGRKNRTGSGSDLNYFSRCISPETHYLVDQHIAKNYPKMWEKYLKQFQYSEDSKIEYTPWIPYSHKYSSANTELKSPQNPIPTWDIEFLATNRKINDRNLSILNDPQFQAMKRQVLLALEKSWCSQEKGTLLMELIVLEEPQTCVEIGVFEGASLLPIASSINFLKRGLLFAIDAWSNAEAIKFMEANDPNRAWWSTVNFEVAYNNLQAMLKRWDFNSFCRVIRKPSNQAISEVNEIDFLHLDGSFTKEGSLNEVELYLPKVKKGGYILLSNALLSSQGKFSKIIALEKLFNYCEIICHVDNKNTILLRKNVVE